jgi:hypothetical protein
VQQRVAEVWFERLHIGIRRDAERSKVYDLCVEFSDDLLRLLREIWQRGRLSRLEESYRSGDTQKRRAPWEIHGCTSAIHR